MAHLTTLEELQSRILVLASIEERNTPFVSCYLNLEQGMDGAIKTIDRRAKLLRRVLGGSDLDDFEDSIAAIKHYLDQELLPEAKGLAFFARSSFGREFYMPLQFAVPLPNLLKIYPTPNIYHLIELKDTYERYLVMITTPEWVRILEVNLGAATIQAWSDNPALRERVGPEWSETHYQLYRRDREGLFLQEKIAALEKLMHTGDHSHLIIAGEPQMTARIRQALPEHLARKVMDIIPASRRDAQTDIVAATLSVFVEQEEQESRSIADRLIQAVRTDGLAAIGAKNCLENLQHGRVDTLVMLQAYHPDPGWLCSTCQAMGTIAPESNICPRCGADTARPADLREELVRLAEKRNCQVEVVEMSDDLAALGGVGCLLRYRAGLESINLATKNIVLRIAGRS
ncbi:baeRF10 domain-containing protein [Thiolapillus sp.]